MHTFWNAGPGPARLLEVIAPAGFEAYFAELAEAGDPATARSGDEVRRDLLRRLGRRVDLPVYNLKLLGH